MPGVAPSLITRWCMPCSLAKHSQQKVASTLHAEATDAAADLQKIRLD